MKDVYFSKVNQIGDLILEFSFLEYEGEPVVFVCQNEAGIRYLCLCTEVRGGKRWLLAETTISLLQELCSESADVRSALLRSETIIVIDSDIEGNEHSFLLNRDDVDELDLPEEGVLLPATYRSNAYMMRLIAQAIAENSKIASQSAAIALQIMTDISVSYNMSGAYEMLRMVTKYLSEIDVSEITSSIVESATVALNEIVSSSNQDYHMEGYETVAENIIGEGDQFLLAA